MKEELAPQIIAKNKPQYCLERPWKLFWQKQTWQFLLNSFTQHNLAHAYLVEGGDGCGSTSFVTAFAQFLHCQKPENLLPCLKCDHCQQIARAHFTDFKLVEVLEGKKQIAVEQIRSLATFFQQTGHSQGYRILLIKNAELMNNAAMNAILKTLEEPGQNSLLFLQTRYPTRLTATIRSRCLKLSLSQVNSNELLEWLTSFKYNSLDSSALKKIVSISRNEPLTSLNCLMQKDGELNTRLMTLFYDCLHKKCSIIEYMADIQKRDLSQIWLWIGQDISLIGNNQFKDREQQIKTISLYNSLQKQLFQVNHLDKLVLLREFLVKCIAISAILDHS